MTQSNRYITYRLGDNDFSGHMQRAAEFLTEFFGKEAIKKIDPTVFRDAMANHMAGESVSRSIFEGHETRGVAWYVEYFCGAKVEFGRAAADADGDSGYVSIDTSTGYIWTH